MLLFLILLLSAANTGRAQFGDAFEGPATSWRLSNSDSNARILHQAPTAEQKHSGQGSEHVQVVAGNGTTCYLTYDLPQRARVIDELRPTLWVLANRAGVQLLARVVFPRSLDPSTGRPLSALIRGTMYRDVGSWQQLRLDDVVKLTQRQARVLRSQFGPEVDERGAYVDTIVLNAYAGSGITSLWIDDLAVEGMVRVSAATFGETGSPDVRDTESAIGGVADADRPPVARMNGSVMVVDQRPFFPRMIEYQGESFESLRALGFDTILLPTAPTSVQMEEAERLDMWLVCRPPQVEGRRPRAASSARVLSWYLGDALDESELPRSRRLAAELARAGSSIARPISGNVAESPWAYSQVLDVLMLDSPPLSGSFELTDHAQRLRLLHRSARPGTPFWARVGSEPPPALERQLKATGAQARTAPDPAQFRLQCYYALAAGARGICVRSDSRLDGDRPEDSLRRMALQLMNVELSVIEPWLSAGSPVEEVESGLPGVRVHVLQTQRARLLLIMHEAPHQQFVVAPAPADPISLVVPNAFSSPQVYHLTAAALQPLRKRRVPGGIRIQIEQPSNIDLVVLTQDPLAINHLSGRLSETRDQALRLHESINESMLRGVSDVHRQLQVVSEVGGQAEQWLNYARAKLIDADRLSRAMDRRSSFQLLEQASRTLARIRRAYWLQAAGGFPTPVSSPLCVCFETLPDHWKMAQKMRDATFSGNSLVGGDMENLDHLLRGGWSNRQRTDRNLTTRVRLSEEDPHSGRFALHLSATADTEDSAVDVLPAAPVQVVSGPVPVRRGQVVRIEGWARTGDRSRGNPDGLMIHDTLGGPALAVRVVDSSAWRRFLMYRCAPSDGDVGIVFELTGAGDAWIDDVSITTHDPAVAGGAPLDARR